MMKKKFWLYQYAAIFCAFVSFFITPIMVYVNYSLLGDEEVILKDVESNFQWAWVVYGSLILGSFLLGVISIYFAKKENKNIIYSFIGMTLSILSLSVFGGYYIGLFLAF